MKFSRKVWLMIILKVTKNEGLTLPLEDTVLEKPRRGSNWPVQTFKDYAVRLVSKLLPPCAIWCFYVLIICIIICIAITIFRRITSLTFY